MRPRLTDRHLPPCVYRKSGAYWLVKRNKWTRLGKEYAEAMLAYAGTVQPTGSGMVKLIDKVYTVHSPKLSANTKKAYGFCAAKLKRVFQEFAPQQVRSKHIAEMKMAMSESPVKANLTLSFLRVVFQYALEWQLVDTNPTIGIKPYPTAKRGRYLSDDEFQAIREKANPVLQIIMDLCYLTGQRVGDVISIQRKDLLEDGIYFAQEKTSARLVVAWTPELREVIERAKTMNRGIMHMNLLVGLQRTPLTYTMVRNYWKEATSDSEIADARIHDIRAKSATDANEQGQNAQKLMGHGNAQMTERYIRRRQIPLVTGPVMKKAKK